MIETPTNQLIRVVPAKAGTHNHRLWNIGPRLRGDDVEKGNVAGGMMYDEP